MANTFLVSVADAILRDPTTGSAIAYGKANISSAFNLTTAETQVRGGISNALLYTYIHDRSLEVNIEEATFEQTILRLNAGVLFDSGSSMVTVTKTECQVLTAGSSASLVGIPIGAVSVFMPDGTIKYATATGSGSNVITVAGGANLKVDAVYKASVAADQITIDTLTPPSVVDLTLIAEVRDTEGDIQEYLQINVPSFQIMGNYSLSLTADGVSSQALSGKALSVASTDCVSGAYYAKVTWVPA